MIITDWILQYWAEWAFGLVAAGLGGCFAWLKKRIKAQGKEQDAVVEGVKAILHDRLYQAYRYYADLGYCPIEDKKNVEYIYKPYHNLGGNGTGTHIFETLMDMSTEPPHNKEENL